MKIGLLLFWLFKFAGVEEIELPPKMSWIPPFTDKMRKVESTGAQL